MASAVQLCMKQYAKGGKQTFVLVEVNSSLLHNSGTLAVFALRWLKESVHAKPKGNQRKHARQMLAPTLYVEAADYWVGFR